MGQPLPAGPGPANAGDRRRCSRLGRGAWPGGDANGRGRFRGGQGIAPGDDANGGGRPRELRVGRLGTPQSREGESTTVRSYQHRRTGPRRLPVSKLPDPEPELRALREARTICEGVAPPERTAASRTSTVRARPACSRKNSSALTAIALCQAQPGREAQDRAAEFLRRSPESPLAARVRSVCDRRANHPGSRASPSGPSDEGHGAKDQASRP